MSLIMALLCCPGVWREGHRWIL